MLEQAIQTPNIDNLGNAISNLQTLGGLEFVKVINDQSKEFPNLKITPLGVYFVNMRSALRVSKMICFAQLLNCLEESFVISSILSQRKSFFKFYKRRTPQQNQFFVSNLFYFDEQAESDVIIQLRIYQLWESKFCPDAIYQTQKDIRKFCKQRIQKEEYKFCDYQDIDPRNMREILLLKEELKERHSQHSPHYIRHAQRKYLPLSQQENIIKIKALLTASFYNSLI